MSRKVLIGLTIAVTVVAAVAIFGWGKSTNWKFKFST